MHFADSIFIFLLALILFGPKKLPEIARQIGKLMVEFRRASNEFKTQIDEELRTMEQQERQKKFEAAAQASVNQNSLPEPTPPLESEPALPQESPQPVIMPPSTGETVSSSRQFVPVAPPEMLEAASAEPHPTYADALAAEKNGTAPAQEQPEKTQATLNHG